ncbi:Dbl homology domain-containing protein, partial [Radiomyces spectabilis]|uniref:Dbl homology domain-containing protein n=1 Tax=Radiomyces spectabilis TaxID=64574 RepID=UPI00221E6A38
MLSSPEDDEPLEAETQRRRKQSIRRLHAIHELLQTERDYVEDLHHLVKICFQQALARQEWIPKSNKQMIMRNADAILAFHQQFLADLEYTLSNDTGNCVITIANLFLHLNQCFLLYTSYCDRHTDALDLCIEYRSKPEWTLFLKECAAVDPMQSPSNPSVANKRLHFEDYLIKPVQRICRYPLLFREILRNTPSETEEHILLREVLRKMQAILTDIDQQKYQRDIRKRTELFIERLEEDWRMKKRHLSRLGNLEIAGALDVTLAAPGQTTTRPRYLGCFVFPTYIIFARAKKVTSYVPKHWFPLKLVEVQELPDRHGKTENTFIIRCRQYVFTLTASCLQEKHLWVNKLVSLVEGAKTKSNVDGHGPEEFLVTSLAGVNLPANTHRQPIRLSHSVTNLFELSKPCPSFTTASLSPYENGSMRRSLSVSLSLHLAKDTDNDNDNEVMPPLPINTMQLIQRYSTDEASQKKCQELKNRNNSETYTKPSLESFGVANMRKRPSSLDLLSSSHYSPGMLGKIRNNHQNTIRISTDHKFRDVCTQEYLSSRAWY